MGDVLAVPSDSMDDPDTDLLDEGAFEEVDENDDIELQEGEFNESVEAL